MNIHKVYATWWSYVLGLIDDDLGGIRAATRLVLPTRVIYRALIPATLWIYRRAEKRRDR